MPARNTRADLDAALGRALVYDFFAQAFAYPDQERFDDLQRLSSVVLTGGGWIPLLRLAAVARELTPELLQAEYVSTLTLSSSPDYPMFETAYFGNDPQQQTQRMADVAGFYRTFGVDASGSDLRPDDLPVELEFMSFLCRKEAYAIDHLGAPRVAQAKKAQRLFFQDHLGCWAGVAGRKLGELGPTGLFYAVAGATLDAWVSAEAEVLGVHPEEVHPGAPMIWPTPMSHGPEFAGDASFVPLEELAVR